MSKCVSGFEMTPIRGLGCMCVRLFDTIILHFNSSAESASAFSMAESTCGLW
jgi:hypothetical protein